MRVSLCVKVSLSVCNLPIKNNNPTILEIFVEKLDIIVVALYLEHSLLFYNLDVAPWLEFCYS